MSIIISTLYYYYTITNSIVCLWPPRCFSSIFSVVVVIMGTYFTGWIGSDKMCSLLKVQRIILTSGAALDYYLNSLFRFKTEVYAARNGKLNEIDRDVFYDMSKVFLHYTKWSCE